MKNFTLTVLWIVLLSLSFVFAQPADNKASRASQVGNTLYFSYEPMNLCPGEEYDLPVYMDACSMCNGRFLLSSIYFHLYISDSSVLEFVTSNWDPIKKMGSPIVTEVDPQMSRLGPVATNSIREFGDVAAYGTRFLFSWFDATGGKPSYWPKYTCQDMDCSGLKVPLFKVRVRCKKRGEAHIAFVPGTNAIYSGVYVSGYEYINIKNRDTAKLSNPPLPEVFAGNDTTVCAGVPTQLKGAKGGVKYEWVDLSKHSTGADTAIRETRVQYPTFKSSKGGLYDYAVKITNEKGCFNYDTIQISAQRNLVNIRMGADTLIDPGQKVVLKAEPYCYEEEYDNSPYTVAWSPDTLVEHPTAENTFSKALYMPTLFIARATDKYGCSQENIQRVNISGASLSASINPFPIYYCGKAVREESVQLNVLTKGGSGDYVFVWWGEGLGHHLHPVFDDSYAIRPWVRYYGPSVITVLIYDMATEEEIIIRDTIRLSPFKEAAVSIDSSLFATAYFCEGEKLHFEADAMYPGSDPLIRWTVNGKIEQEGKSLVFESHKLRKGDYVSVTLYSNEQCVNNSPVVSNVVHPKIEYWRTPSATLSFDPTYRSCGDSVGLLLNLQNQGDSFRYAWIKNATQVVKEGVVSSSDGEFASVVYKFIPSNYLDYYSCRVSQIKGRCVDNDSLATMYIYPLLSPHKTVKGAKVHSSLDGNIDLCENSPFTAYVDSLAFLSKDFRLSWYLKKKNSKEPKELGRYYNETRSTEELAGKQGFHSIPDGETIDFTNFSFLPFEYEVGGFVQAAMNNKFPIEFNRKVDLGGFEMVTFPADEGDTVYYEVETYSSCYDNPQEYGLYKSPMYAVNFLGSFEVDFKVERVSPDEICEGDTEVYKAITSGIDSTYLEFEWYLGKSKLPLSGDSISISSLLPSDTLSCVLKSSYSCVTNLPKHFIAQRPSIINKKPLFSVPQDTTFCKAAENISLSIDTAEGDYTYQWSATPDFSKILSNQSSLAIAQLPDAVQSISYYVKAISSNNCTTIDSTQIHILAPIPIHLSLSTSQDFPLCTTDSLYFRMQISYGTQESLLNGGSDLGFGNTGSDLVSSASGNRGSDLVSEGASGNTGSTNNMGSNTGSGLVSSASGNRGSDLVSEGTSGNTGSTNNMGSNTGYNTGSDLVSEGASGNMGSTNNMGSNTSNTGSDLVSSASGNRGSDLVSEGMARGGQSLKDEPLYEIYAKGRYIPIFKDSILLLPSAGFFAHGDTVRARVTSKIETCLDRRVVSNPIVVNLKEPIKAIITPNQTICKGEEVRLAVLGGSEYQWFLSDSPKISNFEVVSAEREISIKPEKDVFAICRVGDGGICNTKQLTTWVRVAVPVSVSLRVMNENFQTILPRLCEGVDSMAVVLEATPINNNPDSSFFVWFRNGKLLSKTDSNTLHVYVKPNDAMHVLLYTDTLACKTNSPFVSPMISFRSIAPKPLSCTKDTIVCLGADLELWATGASAYTWKNSKGEVAFTGSPFILSAKENELYTVEAIDANGCTTVDSVRVDVNIPQDTLRSIIECVQTNVCDNQAVFFKAKAEHAKQIIWYVNDIPKEMQFPDEQDLSYSAVLKNGDSIWFVSIPKYCVHEASLKSEVLKPQRFKTPSLINKRKNDIICVGDTIHLWAKASVGNTGSDLVFASAKSQNREIQNREGQTLGSEGASGNNTGSDNMGSDLVEGSELSYIWYSDKDSIVSSSWIVTLEKDSRFKVKIFENPACAIEDSVVVKVLPYDKEISLNLSLQDGGSCQGNEALFVAEYTNANVLEWYKNASLYHKQWPATDQASSEFYVDGNKAYWRFVPQDGDSIYVKALSNRRCVLNNPALSQSYTLSRFEVPSISYTGDLEFCEGTPWIFSVEGAESITVYEGLENMNQQLVWAQGKGSIYKEVENSNETKTYYIEYYDNEACKRIDSVKVRAKGASDILSFKLYTKGLSSCDGDSLLIRALTNNVEKVEWFVNDELKQTDLVRSKYFPQFSYIPKNGDKVYIKFSSKLPCISIERFDTVLLVQRTVVPTIRLANDTSVCAGENLIIRAQTDAEKTRWFIDKNGSAIAEGEILSLEDLRFSKKYYAQAENNSLCASWDSILVHVKPLYKPNLRLSLLNDTLCSGEELFMQAEAENNFDLIWLVNGLEAHRNIANNSEGQNSEGQTSGVSEGQRSTEGRSTEGQTSYSEERTSSGRTARGTEGQTSYGQTSGVTSGVKGRSKEGQTSYSWSYIPEMGDKIMLKQEYSGQCIAVSELYSNKLSPLVVKLDVDLDEDKSICLGENVELFAKTNIAPQSIKPMVSLHWEYDGLFNPILDQKIIIKPLKTKNYIAKLTYGRCVASDTVSVEVFSLPAPPYINQEKLCTEKDSALLKANNLPKQYTCLWYKDTLTPSFYLGTECRLPKGLYFVKTRSDKGCISATYSKAVVLQLPPVKAVIVLNQQNIRSKELFRIGNASENADFYRWKFGDGKISSEEEPVHSYDKEGNYAVSLTAIDSYSCSHTAYTSVSVLKPIVEGDICFIPSAFSPMASKDEDKVFRVYGEKIKSSHLMVYDLNGDILFDSRLHGPAWNGQKTNNGNAVVSGNYPYKALIEFENGSIVNKEGIVSLIR